MNAKMVAANNGTQQPKSPARKQCEAAAQQKYSNARAAIPAITGRATALAIWVPTLIVGTGGCVAGGVIGFVGGGVGGGAVGGPGGAAGGGVGGALAGCGTGVLTAIGVAAPQIAGGAVLTAGLTYTWERWEAGQELKNDMAQCAQIP